MQGIKMNGRSFINSVIRDMEKAEEKLLDKAAAYLRDKLKAKVKNKGVSVPGNPPGKQSGDLIKGIKFVRADSGASRLVGFGKPASHAHLLEFGTGPRVVKNFRGHKGVTKDVGPMAPRPFMVPTFEEEAQNVENILSENWI
jgi:HK97 gp10 family phage protein